MGMALTLVAFLASTASQAQPIALQAAAQPRDSAQPAKRQTLICEKQLETGTRLGAKEICLTPEGMAQRRLQERQAIERAQALPCMPSSTDVRGHEQC